MSSCSGASSWRVEEIGHDRVTVSPAPGVPGKLPFWKGDAVGRPIELGRALGAFVGEMEADLARGAKGRAAAATRLRDHHDLDERAAENLLAYLEDEREITGVLPTDRRIVVERFRDELGDWRLCLLTPFGGRVHAPWSLAIEARIAERLGLNVQTIWSDDGIAIRLPEGDAPLDGIEALLFPDAGRARGPRRRPAVDARRCSPAGSARTPPGRCCCRAAGPGRGRRSGSSASARRICSRSPRATAASRSSSRPTANACRTPSTCRRCGRSWPASQRRDITVHSVETAAASPFASSLHVRLRRGLHVRRRHAAGRAPRRRTDPRPRAAPRAARPGGAPRAARPGRPGRPRARASRRSPRIARPRRSTASTTCSGAWAIWRRTRSPPGPRVGRPPPGPWLDELAAARRAVRTRIAGEERWIAVEDVARYRDGVGIAPPVGIPAAFLGPTVGRAGRPARHAGRGPTGRS